MPTEKLKVTFYADDDVAGFVNRFNSGVRSRVLNDVIRRGMNNYESQDAGVRWMNENLVGRDRQILDDEIASIEKRIERIEALLKELKP